MANLCFGEIAENINGKEIGAAEPAGAPCGFHIIAEKRSKESGMSDVLQRLRSSMVQLNQATCRDFLSRLGQSRNNREEPARNLHTFSPVERVKHGKKRAHHDSSLIMESLQDFLIWVSRTEKEPEPTEQNLRRSKNNTFIKEEIEDSDFRVFIFQVPELQGAYYPNCLLHNKVLPRKLQRSSPWRAW